MNYRMVVFVLGRIFLVEAAMMLLPMVCSALYGEWYMLPAFLLPAVILLLLGLLCGALVGNVVLKNLVARPRPCWLDESVQLLIATPKDFSFPSGHTLSSTIGATILTRADHRFGYAAIPLAVLLAFSRLYLYVHFPSDVFAGAVLGLVIGELVSRYGPKLFRRRG